VHVVKPDGVQTILGFLAKPDGVHTTHCARSYDITSRRRAFCARRATQWRPYETGLWRGEYCARRDTRWRPYDTTPKRCAYCVLGMTKVNVHGGM